MSLKSLFPGVAVVTGAGGTGIGAATARAFAAAGCKRIAITDLNEATLKQTRDAIVSAYPETQLLIRTGNIADEAFVEAYMQEVIDTFKRVDYAVNCAGVLGGGQRSTETTSETFDRINGVNYKGCWLCSRAELTHMLKQDPLPSHDLEREPQRGSIVNVASQLGIVGRPEARKSSFAPSVYLTASGSLNSIYFPSAAYCGSKAAVVGMTRSDAIDYSKDGIRVNCVCPGLVETPMTVQSEESLERFRPAIEIAPMKRMGKPAEIADSILFLCSTQASFVQGHALVVDGGYVIN